MWHMTAASGESAAEGEQAMGPSAAKPLAPARVGSRRCAPTQSSDVARGYASACCLRACVCLAPTASAGRRCLEGGSATHSAV